MSDTEQDWRSHWTAYAEAFAQPLQANGLVSRFVTNRNVTGCYAESWIRSTARNMLGRRFRVSTGAVVRASDAGRGLDKVPQCDLIVWDPSELPGLFEAGDFALVPLAAVRGLIEIKRSLSSEPDFTEHLRARRRLVPTGYLLGVVVSHATALRDFECTTNWCSERQRTPDGVDTPPKTRLLDAQNQIDIDGVLALIYFLAQIAGHNRAVVGTKPSS
jgi:hypothetical protein